MKFQRRFALITFILFIILGVAFQSGANSDKWIFPFVGFYGLLVAVSILTWQYTAPQHARLIFKVEPPKSKYAFWISTVILFCLFTFGFFGLITVMPTIVHDPTQPFNFSNKDNFLIIVAIFAFSLFTSFNNRKYYQ